MSKETYYISKACWCILHQKRPTNTISMCQKRPTNAIVIHQKRPDNAVTPPDTLYIKRDILKRPTDVKRDLSYITRDLLKRSTNVKRDPSYIKRGLLML